MASSALARYVHRLHELTVGLKPGERYEPIAISAADFQCCESRSYSAEEVAKLFSVSASALVELAPAPSNGSAQPAGDRSAAALTLASDETVEPAPDRLDRESGQ